MKANEAPERIYFSTSASHPFYGLTRKWADDDIEYVRLDAFIEKACGWLKSNLYDYAGEDDKRNIVPFDDAIFEDFKKAMEE